MKENLNACDTNLPVHGRVCWSAVVAGAFVGLGLGFLLQLYGIAMGLSAYQSTANGAVLAVGGFIGLVVGTIVSMGAAGFVAGYLGRFHYCHCHGGMLYGFLTWTMALLLGAVMALPLSHYTTLSTAALSPSLSVTMDNKVVHSSVSTESKKTMTLKANASSEALASAPWLVFALFFIGAFSSCIGACCGMGCRRNHLDAMDSKTGTLKG